MRVSVCSLRVQCSLVLAASARRHRCQSALCATAGGVVVSWDGKAVAHSGAGTGSSSHHA